MKDTSSNIVIFAIGVAIGSVVTWKILKDKYEQISREEIASVKEVFSERLNGMKKTEKTTENTDETHDDEVDIYKQVARDYNKVSTERVGERKDGEDLKKPYVIPPDIFGEDDYETESLTYYADGVLTNDFDEVFDDDEVEEHVGRESLTHFGDYEDDSVFVRNENEHCDYEILRDTRSYKDVMGG